MKTAITSFILSAMLAASTFAGSTATFDKRVVPSQPEPACFGPGFALGIFGGGFLPTHKADDFDNALGGGVLAEYFFNENIGLQFSYGAFATSGTQHLFNGDIILRAPIQSACAAPYLMVGGGFHVDGSSLGEFHAGAGIECRFKGNPNLGLFADGAYYWHGASNRDHDFTVVRIGVKFAL